MLETQKRTLKLKRSPRQEVWADAKVLAQCVRPGMLYGHFRQGDPTGWETRFFIHENRACLEQLGADPAVQLRAGIFYADTAIVVPVLARIGTKVYESWLDYYRTNTSLCFANLMHQASIVIALYNMDSLRQFRVANESRSVFERAMREISHASAWSAGVFYRAQHQVCLRYPTTDALWTAVTSGPLAARD